MIDPLFEYWVGDGTRFAPQSTYTVIEARSNLDGSDHDVKEKRVSEQDALTILTTSVVPTSSQSYHVKVLLLDFATRRLSCSQSLFKALHERWSLPNCAIDHLFTRRPASINFTDPPNDSVAPSRFGVLGPSINHQCVWMYKAEDRTLVALFAAKRDTAAQLQQWLRTAPETICHPAVPLLLLCEQILDGEVRRRLELQSHHLDTDARLLGMVPSDPGAADLDEKHLDQATRSLTLTLEGVAWFISKLDRLDIALDVLDRFTFLFEESRAASPQFDRWGAELKQRMTALRARSTGYRAHATRMQLQGQAMLQTVFCLIGTNDNRLSHQAAQASVKIAGESRRIAEDSKKVAMLTRKDSTDMRIIAAVTLLFLPGTFVAVRAISHLIITGRMLTIVCKTFFSTSFLDFLSSDDGSARVSPLGIGLYWAVTASLTFIVLLAWLRVSKVQIAKDAAAFQTSS